MLDAGVIPFRGKAGNDFQFARQRVRLDAKKPLDQRAGIDADGVGKIALRLAARHVVRASCSRHFPDTGRETSSRAARP